MAKRSCVTCGETISHSGRYCGRACNPELETNCKVCGVELKNFQTKFCSRSCSASHNNVVHPRRALEGVCVVCDSPCSKGYKRCKTCIAKGTAVENAELKKRGIENKTVKKDNYKCEFVSYNALKASKWVDGTWSGATSTGLSGTIRAYLLDINDYKCSLCGFDTPHPLDNRTILEIDHIDGDAMNNTAENLRVVCPNCHALTDSYRARNVGKCTRAFHYLRVDKI